MQVPNQPVAAFSPWKLLRALGPAVLIFGGSGWFFLHLAVRDLISLLNLTFWLVMVCVVVLFAAILANVAAWLRSGGAAIQLIDGQVEFFSHDDFMPAFKRTPIEDVHSVALRPRSFFQVVRLGIVRRSGGAATAAVHLMRGKPEQVRDALTAALTAAGAVLETPPEPGLGDVVE